LSGFRRRFTNTSARANAAPLRPLRRHASTTCSASAARQYRQAISPASARVVSFCLSGSDRIPHLLSARQCSQAVRRFHLSTVPALGAGLLERLAGGRPQRRIDELLPEHHVPAAQSAEAAVAELQRIG